MDLWNRGTDQQRAQALNGIGVSQEVFDASPLMQDVWRRQAMDTFHANRLNGFKPETNSGLSSSRTPPQNLYRPDPRSPGFAVNAYGQRIPIGGNASLLGNSPLTVAGWNGRNMELNGRHYVGQRRFAPGTRVINRYGFS